MATRGYLLKALKVLFPNKSSFRVRQSDIPLVLYSYECYRRKITEVELSSDFFLSDKYLRSGKRLTSIHRKPPSLVYMAGYLRKKFNIRSSTDILLMALACGMKNPSRLVVASLRFQHNKRLSKLSAKEIRKEWTKVYQEAEVMLTAFTEEKIRAVKEKRGNEWRKVFAEIEANLGKVSLTEIAAGLTLYFWKKKKDRIEETYTVDAEKVFLFDTLFQLLKFGNIQNPIDLKRVSIDETLPAEAVSLVSYLVRRAEKEGITASSSSFTTFCQKYQTMSRDS